MSSCIPVGQPGEVVKSPNDQRQYRLLTLSNALDVMLVSDPETDKSAASLAVGVGSMADPSHLPGLAHFLEHMLFMGTEKYPGENAYMQYLSSHGGASNAYTSQDCTVYYFDVSSDALQGALDIFASFFTSPLFSESSLDRERQAVDSEHDKNIQSDSWRLYQLQKQISDPKHPFSKFSTGNIKTLKDDVDAANINLREEMLKFYHAHYSSNIAKLCIYGRESLDELEAWAKELFSSMPNRNLEELHFDPNPFPRETSCAKTVVYKPVVDKKSINIVFPLPSMRAYAKNPPRKIVSHLIGHESDGSLLALLKASNYANALASYVSEVCADFASFHTVIDLTDHGVEHIDEVMSMFFTYVGMLLEGIPNWIPEEIQQLDYINFLFDEKTRPSDYVTSIVSNMLSFNKDPMLLYLPAIVDIDTSIAYNIIKEYFIPENCIIFYKNKNIFEDAEEAKSSSYRTESFYNIVYYEQAFSSSQMQTWRDCVSGANKTFRSGVHLPDINPFVPTDFTLRSETLSSTSKLAASSEVVTATDVNISVEGEVNNTDHSSKYPKLIENVKFGCRDDQSVFPDGATTESSIFKVPRSKSVTTWFKMDRSWKVPKIVMSCRIISAEFSSSAVNVALTELLCLFIEEKLNNDTYFAPIANLEYKIVPMHNGDHRQVTVHSCIQVYVSGFSHKAMTLMGKILREFRQFANGATHNDAESEEMFVRLLKKLRTQLSFSLLQSAIQINRRALFQVVEDGRVSLLDILDAVGYQGNASEDDNLNLGLTYRDLRVFASRVFKVGFTSKASEGNVASSYVGNSGMFRVENFIHGNATEAEALDFSNQIRSILTDVPMKKESNIMPVISLSAAHEKFRRNVNISLPSVPAQVKCGEEGEVKTVSINPTVITRCHSKHFNPEEKNHICESIYFFGDCPNKITQSNAETIRTEAMAELICQMTSESFFDTLRTKEQLGYVVYLSTFKSLERLGIDTIIQSNNTAPDQINDRVESFLKSHLESMKTMSAEQFEFFKKSVVDLLTEKEKNLEEEALTLAREISNQQLLFNRNILVSDAVSQLTLEDVCQYFYSKIVSKESRCKITGYFYGKGALYTQLNSSPASAPVESVDDIQEVFHEVTDPIVFRNSMGLASRLNCADM